MSQVSLKLDLEQNLSPVLLNIMFLNLVAPESEVRNMCVLLLTVVCGGTIFSLLVWTLCVCVCTTQASLSIGCLASGSVVLMSCVSQEKLQDWMWPTQRLRETQEAGGQERVTQHNPLPRSHNHTTSNIISCCAYISKLLSVSEASSSSSLSGSSFWHTVWFSGSTPILWCWISVWEQTCRENV